MPATTCRHVEPVDQACLPGLRQQERESGLRGFRTAGDYVHNMWPARGDERLFGWRVPKNWEKYAQRRSRAKERWMRCVTTSAVSASCFRSTA